MSYYIRNAKGKKCIPYTQTNSFFYVKDASEPLPFLAIAPDKVDPQPQGRSTPKESFNFLKNLRESIKNLDNCEIKEEIPRTKIKK